MWESGVGFVREIRIFGFNDEYDLIIPVRRDHCIFVGPNGAGKSTALQIISYALGRKFRALSKLRFERIELDFENQTASLSREACAPSSWKYRKRNVREMLGPNSLFVEELALAEYEKLLSEADREFRLSSVLGDNAAARKKDRANIAEIEAFTDFLKKNSVPRTLYLPTSRRIEVELSKLTARVSDYLKSELATQLKAPQTDTYFEEIIRFGMEDIDSLIRDFEVKAQTESRNRFNRMMTFLLKEIANQEKISVKEIRSRDIGETEIREVLLRIEKGVLDPQERDQIVGIVRSMSESSVGHPPYYKTWLSHFFVRLMDVDKELNKIEEPMKRFVNAMQKYLGNKIAKYDIEDYKLSISSQRGTVLKLADLSSGEKQLVSLLAMLEFSSVQSNVMIDEPELSLSVPWQSTVLTDVVASGACNQLFAVTHSPFVYDNELIESVVDFSECLVQR
jgi:predicted ATPase